MGVSRSRSGIDLAGRVRMVSAADYTRSWRIMFGMGTALTLADFKRVAEQPYPVAVGLVAQFLIMPFMAAAIAKIFELPPAIAAGLILVGSCPGGTASNVMTYLAKGDVALSVTMTSCSTIASVVATPI